MNGPILRGDPFNMPEDADAPWQTRLELLQARAHRPWVAVRGEDLRLALGLLRAIRRQAHLAEAHNDRLRHEIADLEAQLVSKHAPLWEAEEEAA